MENSQKELTPLFKIIQTIWKYRKFLFIFNFSIALITVIILLIIPKEYKSTALASVETGGNMLQIPAILQDLPFGIGGGGGEDIQRYISLGNSRRVLNAVIDKFNLDQWYETEYREDTYKAVTGNLKIIDNEDGTISISFICEDNKLAAEIVLEFFEQIKSLDIELSITQAKIFKDFIEQRYQEALEILTQYEDSLKVFSEVSGIIAVEEQIKQSIQFLAELETKKLDLEIQRDFLKANMSNKNLNLAQLEGQVKILRNKIRSIHKEDAYSNVPLDSLPKQSLTYLRLFRKVKIQEAILEFLVPQVENAKIEEKKNYSSILLIDKPVPAERKFRPKRAQLLIIIMFISFIFSLVAVRFLEMYKINKPFIKELLIK